MELPGEGLIHQFLKSKHIIFRNQVREFLKSIEEEIYEAQKKDVFPLEVYRKFAEAKLLGLNFPPQVGGQGADTVSCVILIEEIAQLSSSIAGIITTAGITGPYLILKHGTKEQKERYLPLVCTGDIIVSFALTEPDAGSDVTLLSTYAIKDGDYYILNGTKTFVSHAPIANLFLTTARTGEGRKECTVFLVEKQTPGVSVSEPFKKIGWWCQEIGELYLNAVKLHKSSILGKENAGLRVPMVSINLTRILLSAIAIGLTRRFLQEATLFVKRSSAVSFRRSQFVRARLSEAISQWVSIRTFLYLAAKSLDKNMLGRAETSMLKFLATELAKKVTQQCLWVFGPEVVNKYFGPSIAYADAPIFTIADGTSEIQLENVARGLGILERVGEL